MDASLSSEMETMVPDSITSESQEAAKVVTSAKLELSLESEMELVLDSISPDSKMEVAVDSEEVAGFQEKRITCIVIISHGMF